MDTTAAAELGGGVVEVGVGYWDGGVGESEGGWSEKGTAGQSIPSWGDGGGVASHGRGNRPAAENEPPFKRMRNMGGGDGPSYASGSGNYNNVVSGSNGGQGGNAGGFGPGTGASPSRKNFGPSPGTPSVETTPGSGQGQGGVSRGRGMGSIFYKTKLCSRFRNGNCPYNTNCNFAHGIEELRKPPPGWEDVVAAQDGGGGGAAAPAAASLPAGQGSSGGNGERIGGGGAGAGGGGRMGGGNASGEGGGNVSDMQRFHKTRPCKKFFSELGCPYGDRCNFLHDEHNSQPKASREIVVVTVSTNGASGSGSGGGGVGGGTVNLRPPNWKTRLCNKWETTGNCPFGEKCHFAHGTAELQRYGGGPFDSTSEVGAGAQMDSKFGNQANTFLDGDDVFLSSFGDGYTQVMNVRQSTSLSMQQSSRHNYGPGGGFKCSEGWKGPTDRISTIYGDWVEEDEWEHSPAQGAKSTHQQERGSDLNYTGTQGWGGELVTTVGANQR